MSLLLTPTRQLTKCDILEKLPARQGVGAKNLKKGSRKLSVRGQALMDGVVSQIK